MTVERPLVPLVGSGALTLEAMTTRLSSGASGAIRRFAGWVARGSVGYPLLEGIDYWSELADSPSQMETCFAIFANVLELDAAGNPTNEKYAERRAALWLYQYCTGSIPPSEQPLEGWEVELYLRHVLSEKLPFIPPSRRLGEGVRTETNRPGC